MATTKTAPPQETAASPTSTTTANATTGPEKSTTPAEQSGTSTAASTDPGKAGTSSNGPGTPEPRREPAESTDAPTQTDTLARLEEIDLDALLKDRRIQGKLGELADKRARAIQAEKDRKEAEDRAKREEQELEKLLDEDPYEYRERKKSKEAEKKKQEELQQIAQASWGEIDALLYSFAGTLPKEVNEALADKKYNATTSAEARMAYISDVVEQVAEHRFRERFAKEMAKREKEIREATRKELLGEVAEGDESPDLGAGRAGSGALGREEWTRNRANPIWRRQNRERINAALAAGVITS